VTDKSKWAHGILGDAARKGQCAVMPRIPQTFHAKRKFFTFLNTIVFEDRHGVEFGFVESWLMDIKNLFGFPGASFYLKAASTAGLTGKFNLEGPTPDQDGTFNTDNAAKNQAQTAPQETWEQFFSSMRGKNSGFGMYGDASHRLAAFMVGNRDLPNGKPWLDQMTIMDCKGQVSHRAQDGLLIYREATDAQYYQRRTNTENELIVEDLGQPPQPLVRITMKEPCHPFPPFCANMGMWNWFMHGYAWEGKVMRAASDSAMANGLLKMKLTNGEAEDVRFLTLYSMYQFSNTRWSPFMNWIWWILFFSPCLWCCWRRPCSNMQVWYGDQAGANAKEETQKLMQTQEVEMGTKVPDAQMATGGGFMACCSRRGGRGIVAAN